MKEKNEKNTAGMELIPPTLVAEARAGDQAAFTELYQRTSSLVYRTIRSMIGDEDLVWDVQQEVYLRAWKGLPELQTPEAFLPWLRRTAVNTAVNALNKRVPLTFTELAGEEDEAEPELPDPDPAGQPELALDRKESSRLVRELLEALPPEQQAVVGMRYYEDMPVKDIAALLNVTPGTVKTQLSRGRKRIEAGVRALEKQGVKLYGLSPLPFLLALLRRLEPAAGAEQKALAAVLAKAPAAGAAAGETAATVTAMTAGQAFLHGLGTKLLAGALAVAVLAVGGKLAYDALQKGSEPPVGPEQPTLTETAEDLTRLASSETPEFLETEPTVPVSTEPELTEPATTEPPAEPIILASGSFGLRQREEQADPDELLPYFKAIDPDADDRIYTNNAVEIRYDGLGVRQRTLPDGEEELLFPLERSEENGIHLFGVTENRLYFNCHNPDPDDWWGVSVFSLNRQGEDRQELGSNWDYFFENGWVALRSFASDVRPTTAKIFNRNDELVFEQTQERVWALAAVGESLDCVCVLENPEAGGGAADESAWWEHLIRLDPDGTQTLLMQLPVPAERGDYGLESTISDGVIWISGSDTGLYDLYTLEPLEDRYHSSFYDDSLTWTLDDAGVLTISGSGLMGDSWFQPWEEYREQIKAVVLEEGVPNIGSYKFSACTALKRVSIPDSVTAIGGHAFSECTALKHVTIPDSVTQLGRGVFASCSNLSEVQLPAGLTKLSDSLFSSCASLASVTLPDSVTAIGGYVFNGCRALSEVTIPEGVTSIGERAFWRCSDLTGVTVPKGVTSIGSEAFGWDYSVSGESVPVSDFTVSGAEGSAAQSYAEENGFRFVKVG